MSYTTKLFYRICAEPPLYHFLLLPRLLVELVPVVYDPTFPIIFQSTLSVTILANKRSAVDLLEVLG